MRIGSNKGSEVEAYTDFIKEAEGLKSTLRTAWTAEGRQESTVPCSRPGGTVQRRHIGSIAAGCR